MKRKMISRALKGFVALFGVAWAGVFYGVLPVLGQEIAEREPEFAWAFVPCLVWELLFSLPGLALTVPAWRIFGTLTEKGKAFSLVNAKRFRLMSTLCWCECSLFVAGTVALGIMGAGHPFLWLICLPGTVLLFGAAGFACYAMSLLVKESAQMREENELTI